MSNTQMSSDKPIDYKYLIFYLLSKWKVFTISVILGLIASILISKSTSLSTTIRGSLLVYDDKVSKDENDFMEEFDYFARPVNVDNEVVLLTSSSIIETVIDTLGLSVGIYNKSFLSENELFGEASPIEVIFKDRRKRFSSGAELSVNKKTDGSLELQGSHELYGAFGPQQYHFGENIDVWGEQFKIELRPLISTEWSELSIKFRQFSGLVNSIKNRLTVFKTGRTSSTIYVNFISSHVRKGEAILNTLMSNYIAQEEKQRDLQVTRAESFIDKKLLDIKYELVQTENQLKSYRETNEIIDISEKGNALYNELLEKGSELEETKEKLDYYEYLVEQVNDTTSEEITPPNVVNINDPVLNDLILSYNKMRNTLISYKSSASEINPQVVTLTSQMENVLRTIKSNLKNLTNVTEIQNRELSRGVSQLRNDLAKLPGNEKDLLEIQREFELSQNLYLYLQERKSDAQIAKAGQVSWVRVIDRAHADPIGLLDRFSKQVVMMFVAFLIPMFYFLVREFFNDTIRDFSSLSTALGVPVLGPYPLNEKKKKLSSAFNEGVRLLWSRLAKFDPTSARKSVILISAYSGELSNKKQLTGVLSLAHAQHDHLLWIDLNFTDPLVEQVYGPVGKDTGPAIRGAREIEEFIVSNDNGVSVLALGEAITPENIDNRDYKFLIDQLPKLQAQYDMIIISCPPLDDFSDVVELSPVATSTILTLHTGMFDKQDQRKLEAMYESDLLSNSLCFVTS